MHPAPTFLPLLLAALLAPYATPVAALGVGELVPHSFLGEPLRAEAQLLRAGDERTDAQCIRSAPAGGNDDIPWIPGIRTQLVGDRVLLTTTEPVHHPVAMISLRLGCGAELRRDFTILLQPPRSARISSEQAAFPQALQSSPGNTPAPGTMDGPSGKARASWQDAPRTGTLPLSTAASPRGARTPPANSPKASARLPRREDRLIIGQGAEAGLQPLRMSLDLATPPRDMPPMASGEASRQEQKILADIDDRIAAQLEVDEKIRRLEEYQTLLRDRLAQQAPSRAPAQPAAPPPASPEEGSPAAPRADMGGWTQTLIGILTAVIGGGALIWLRRRRDEDRPTGAPTEPGRGMFPADADDVAPMTSHAPLTEGASLVESRAQPRTTTSNARRPPDTTGDWSEPEPAPAHPIPYNPEEDEQDSALELAEIMMSFGRTQGAAETLADYIRNNPRQAVKPWLKLLEVYHVAGMRAEFEVLTRQLNKTFNVKMIGWNDFKSVRSAPDTLEQMPHLIQQLQAIWRTQEAQVYIHQILRDNRNGTREGFPLVVVEELLLLLAILDDELGTYRPPSDLSLVAMEPRPDPHQDSATA